MGLASTRLAAALVVAWLGVTALAPIPSVAEDVSTPADCDAALAGADSKSGSLLFAGATVCGEEKRHADANFLTIAGQIRTITDLAILKPADDENDAKAFAAAMLYYHGFSGLGSDEVYRVPTETDALEARLRAFAPPFSGDYDPGWIYTQSSKTDIYAAVLAAQREQVIWQMLNHARKMQNDEYFAAYQAIAEFRRDYSVFKRDSPEMQRYESLNEALTEAAKDIAELPPPAADMSFMDRVNEQDAEMAALQVAAGHNGPQEEGTDLFRSATEVHASWLAAALPASDLEAMLDRTDFSKQFLVAYRFGERMNASGNVMIVDLRYFSRFPKYVIAARMDVVPKECGVAFAASYPFVVGQVEAVEGAEVGTESSSDFDDGCGAIVSSAPAAIP